MESSAMLYARRFTDDWLTTRATNTATSTYFLRFDDARGLNTVATGTVRQADSVLFGVDARGALSINHGTSSPVKVGSLALGVAPRAIALSGRYAYVVDSSSSDLKVID